MSEASPISPSDERLFSGISYLFGLVVALLVWGTQQERSRFVRFHSLQAIGLDIFPLISGWLVSGCLTILIFALIALMVAGILATSVYVDPDSPAYLLAFVVPASLPILIIIPVFLWIGAVLSVPIYAAVKVFQGHDIHFPILGKQLDHLLLRG